jgi:membrane-associated tyrosine/threonine-specific cdc2-inhibitory kinase
LEENINISEDQIWHFITDLTLGLKHIHDNNIVHLDIKPANIFLSFEHDKKLNSSNSSEFFNLKIGDYGIAFDITQVIDFIINFYIKSLNFINF